MAGSRWGEVVKGTQSHVSLLRDEEGRESPIKT